MWATCARKLKVIQQPNVVGSSGGDDSKMLSIWRRNAISDRVAIELQQGLYFAMQVYILKRRASLVVVHREPPFTVRRPIESCQIDRALYGDCLLRLALQ